MMRTGLQLICLVALALGSANRVWGSEVIWGNTGGNGNPIALSTGVLVPTGDLVEVGAFPGLTGAQIASSSFSSLQSSFVIFATSTVGANSGGLGAGYWEADSTATAASVAGNQIYYYVFNAATAAAATQQGIYTDPGAAAWVFPADAAVPNLTRTDLSDVPNSSAGIVVGSFGTGSAFGIPAYDLAVINTPEPSTFVIAALGILGLGGLVCRRRRLS